MTDPQTPDAQWTLKDGVSMIAVERARQMAKEGYSDAHDDRYVTCSLAMAGAAYACHAAGRLDARGLWPFDEDWWKPSVGDPVRDLVKAGALIAAEIDRIQRLQGDALVAPAPAESTITGNDLALVMRAIRPLDSGALHCRYCPAGSNNQWQHTEHCIYAESVKDAEAARRIVTALRMQKASPAPATFWVIEQFTDGKSQGYWDGGSSRSFTKDIDASQQFCRKVDAHRAIWGWHWKDVRITEHLYMQPLGRQEAAPPQETPHG